MAMNIIKGITSNDLLIVHLTILFMVLPTLFIIFRFWSRAISTASTKFWWDDWLALLAWGASIVNCSLVLRIVELVRRRPVEALQPPEDIVTEILPLNYFYQILYDVGVTFAKFSALLFYQRVFASRSKWFNIAYGVTLVLVAIFILYKLPMQIFSCVPPRKNWEPDIDGYCGDDYTNVQFLVAGLVLDVITDLFILVLPIPLIAKLHTTRKKKFALLGAFVLGSIALVTSVGRTISIILIEWRTEDPAIGRYQSSALAWSLAETSVSVTSICVPSCFYLAKRWGSSGFASLFTFRDVSIPAHKAHQAVSGRENRGIQLRRQSGDEHSLDSSPETSSSSGSSSSSTMLARSLYLHETAPGTTANRSGVNDITRVEGPGTIHDQSDVSLTYEDYRQEGALQTTRREWV